MTGADPSPRGAAVFWAVAIALFVLAAAMRLRQLGLPVAADYNEGVYWQTLRSMGAGYGLYDQVFFSQPPLFAWVTFPVFEVFGATLSAARLGVALVSLIGLAGAFAVGCAIAGRIGGIGALLLVATAPVYHDASLTLQGDGPAVAAQFVVLAFALWWWRKPSWGLAVGCAIALAAGILIKLVVITAAIPVAVIAVMSLLDARGQRDILAKRLRHIGLAFVAGLLFTLVVVAPHLHAWPQLVSQVVTYHTDARQAFSSGDRLTDVLNNLGLISQFVSSNLALSIAAAVGFVVAVVSRRREALPIVALLAASGLLLVMHIPLFPPHLIVVVPPLVALACFSLDLRSGSRALRLAAALPLSATVMVGAIDLARFAGQADGGAVDRNRVVADDLAGHAGREGWVVTDDQFVAGLADRDVPPGLADTSFVRLRTGYLSDDELCNAIGDPRVGAVYFATGRLETRSRFSACVAAEFRLLREYSLDHALWVRASATDR